jgi:hypothetical protein
MQKRGQVTIFITLGVLIVIIFGMFFFLKSGTTTEELKTEIETVETASIKMFVEDCLEKTAREGTLLLGRQGGYYEAKNIFHESPTYSAPEIVTLSEKYNDNLIQTNNLQDVNEEIIELEGPNLELDYYGFKNLFRSVSTYSIPYYFNLGNDTSPDIETLELELGKYVEENIDDCLNFELIKGKEINAGELNVKTKINPETITIKAIYPIEIKEDTSQKMIESFNLDVPSYLGKAYNTTKEIMVTQQENNNSIPLSFITDLSEDKGFKFTTTNFGDDVLYSLFFNLSNKDNLEESNYNYNFMVRYNWNDTFNEVEDELILPTEENEEIEFSEYNDEENIMKRQSKEVKVRLFQIPADSSNENSQDWNEIDWSNPQISNDDFWNGLEEDPSRLNNPNIRTYFESKLNDPSFINELNNKKDILNEWGKLIGPITFEGDLESYNNGEITTVGARNVFNPRDVPGAKVLSSGELVLADGTKLNGLRIIRDRSGKYIINEVANSQDPIIDFSSVDSGRGRFQIESGKVIIENENQKHVIRKNDERTLLIEINGKNTRIIGNAFFESELDGQERKFSINGKIEIVEDQIKVFQNTKITTYSNTENTADLIKGKEFLSNKGLIYQWRKDGCNNIDVSCIEDINDGQSRIFLRGTGAKLRLDVYDDSTKSLFVDRITGRNSEVVVRDHSRGNVELTFNNNLKNPINVKGDPSHLSFEIKHKFFSDERYRFFESRFKGIHSEFSLTSFIKMMGTNNEEEIRREFERGVRRNNRGEIVSVRLTQRIKNIIAGKSVNQILLSPEPIEEGHLKVSTVGGVNEDIITFAGRMTKESLAYMNAMRQKSNNADIGWIAKRLDDPEELRVIEALASAAEKSGLSFELVTAAAFREGLNLWLDKRYSINPDSQLDSFSDMGIDAFEKEYRTYLRRQNCISSAGSSSGEGRCIRRTFRLGTDFEYGKNQRGEILTVKGERGEEFRKVYFEDIERASEAFGAMLKRRQQLVIKDLVQFGGTKYNPSNIPPDVLNYWTYIYYNSGSHADHGDPKGTGRDKLIHAINARTLYSALNRQYDPKINEDGIATNAYYNSQKTLLAIRKIEELTPIDSARLLALEE